MTPQPTAGPRCRDRSGAPPRPSGGGARKPEGPRHSPPPPPQAEERTEADRRDGSPLAPPKRPLHPGVMRAPRPRQVTPVNRPHAPALPAAGRRQTGGAQDGANGAAPTKAGLGKAGARTRAGGFPPPPSPPVALTNWRPTRQRPAPAAARQPPRHEYTPGGRAGDNGWQADDRRGGGAGGGGAAPPPPPPSPPPSLRATGATLRPPSPRRDRDAGGGGGCGWTCTPRAPAPPAACSRGGRGRRASRHQRA